MTDCRVENVCINTNAFIFNSCCVRAKKNKSKKYKKRDYLNIVKPKCAVFELSKSKFNSCSLGISNNINDAWTVLLDNLSNINKNYFLISLTNCDKECKTIHKTFAQLIKYKISDGKNHLKLYFVCNLNPFDINSNCCADGSCLQLNTDVFYNLEKKEYCNIQFWYDKNYIYTPIQNNQITL